MAKAKPKTGWRNRIVGHGEEVPDQLLANPLNWRIHPAFQQDALKEVLDKVGLVQSVVVNKRTGNLVDGHLRAQLAMRNGDQKLPVVYVDLSEDDERLVLATMDPLSAMAGTDKDKLSSLLMDLKDGGVGVLLEQIKKEYKIPINGGIDSPARVDEAAKLQKKWKVERGQLWQLGWHRLLCGDATDKKAVKRLLDGGSPNLMVTDPPYGVSYDANWRNEAADKGLIDHARRRVGIIANDDRADWKDGYALFKGDIIYVWHAGVMPHISYQNLADCGFEIRGQIIWAKPRFAISRGHYNGQHEPCWYAVRKGATAHWIGDQSQSTLWLIALDPNIEGGHSTQKPLECMQRPIRNHSGDVYDPFCGTGTTIIAAENEHRVCYALEIEPAYVAIALQRWMDTTGEKPKRG